ncbi:MAG: CPBP family intramembrane metalloprotease [Thermodesulfovibrionales bacterium]|nr:CPBP family intramembrane metalloprotease [Thermodesulfovibrionales bacterium]
MKKSKNFIYLSVVIIIVLNFLTYFTELNWPYYLLPLLLIMIPLIYNENLNICLSKKDLFLGLISSFLFITPFMIYKIYSNSKKTFILPDEAQIYKILLNSITEEFFFRGFIQENIGNNFKGNIITSFIFSFSHLPALIFYNDPFAILTFFPSLIMGWLYIKTKNLIPCILFHFLANTAWSAVR